MGAGVAGAEHTEHDTEGGTVEGGPHQVVVAQDKEAKDPEVHQEHVIAKSGGNTHVALFIGDEAPVGLGDAAHGQGGNDGKTKEHTAEEVGPKAGGHLQGLRCGSTRELYTQGGKEDGLEDEGTHTHRQSGVIEVIALVDIGGVGQPRGDEEAADEANNNGQHRTLGGEAHGSLIGVAGEQVGDQRGDAGGKEHGGHIVLHGPLFHHAVEHGAEHRGPDVQNVDAPGGETHGEHNGQGGHIVELRPENEVQPQTGQGHEGHVEEGGAVAAYGKVVGGDLAGLGQDLLHALKQEGPVRRYQGRDEKGQGKEQEKQDEKIVLREILDFFHSSFLSRAYLKTGNMTNSEGFFA